MHPTRRVFIMGAAAALCKLTRARSFQNAVATESAMVPVPSMPWTDAKRIIGERGQYTEAEKRRLYEPPNIALLERETLYNDFCFIRDKVGRWHCIGIAVVNGKDEALFHAVSDSIDGTYRHLAQIRSGFSAGINSLHMWAPMALWRDDGMAVMYYGHLVTAPSGTILESTMRELRANDQKLEIWGPANSPAGSNVVFEDLSCRDPMVVRDDEHDRYLMYYASDVVGSDSKRNGVIKVRKSKDMTNWSMPHVVMTAPPGYTAVESPFILVRDGLYYLWVSGFDYGRMSLYISEDPMSFGDAVDNRIMEQSGHAAEVVFSEGDYWMGCVAIAKKFGNAPAVVDLPGVYVQKLNWIEADERALSRIVRAKKERMP